jgi:parallel beta-helix repeat protein
VFLPNNRLEISAMRTTLLLLTLTLGLTSRSWAQVYIPAGTNIQSEVDSHSAGTVYTLGTGLHTMQSIEPKTGDQFYGESGTILSGARELSGWTSTTCGASSCWVVTGQGQQGVLTPGEQTFDGVDDTFPLASGNLGQFTISMFYTPSSRPAGGTIDVLGSLGEETASEPWLAFMPTLYVNPVGQAVGVVWEGGVIGVASTTTLEIGRRYHLALTCDGNELRLYVDAVLEESNAATCPVTGFANPIFRLGATVSFGPSERVHGELSFVGIWADDLSAAQIGTLATTTDPLAISAARTAYSPLTNCQFDSPRCNYPEDVWFDNVLKRHVPLREQVGPGTWHFDYGNDAIYVGDNPSGHMVETSVTPHAFTGNATDVLVSALRIEKYAVPTQVGAAMNLGTRWRLEYSEVARNHYAGVGSSDDSVAELNNVHHNGAFGFVGAGVNIQVISNEIAYNNTAGYNQFWGAGGSKWVFTTGLVVRGNWSHNNKGPGLWTDINNSGCLYDSNTVDDNDRQGIFHEISYSCVITGNTIRRNGLVSCVAIPGWIEGAGIQVDASPDVEIKENYLENNCHGIGAVQTARGAGNMGPWELHDLYVHDNIAVMADDPSLGQISRWNGLIQSVNDSTYFSGRNNRWENNDYTFHAVDRPFFTWNDQFDLTFDEWQGMPHLQDVNGEVHPVE